MFSTIENSFVNGVPPLLGQSVNAFTKISEQMGDDFKRRVLEGDGTPRSLINVYINGKNAKFSDGLNTVLKDND